MKYTELIVYLNYQTNNDTFLTYHYQSSRSIEFTNSENKNEKVFVEEKENAKYHVRM